MYSSYTGLGLKEYTSGKTVKGKVTISKIGGRQIRQTLMNNYSKIEIDSYLQNLSLRNNKS